MRLALGKSGFKALDIGHLLSTKRVNQPGAQPRELMRSMRRLRHMKFQFWATVIPVAIQGAIARSCGM